MDAGFGCCRGGFAAPEGFFVALPKKMIMSVVFWVSRRKVVVVN